MWHVILTVAILVLMVVSCADTGTRHEAQATAGSGGQLLQPEPAAAARQNVEPLGDLTMKNIDGEDVSLARYDGRVVLIVNVASRCGYTRQYAGLQALHEAYGAKGLAILGFPANDFGQQEPGSDDQIKSFCRKNYGVSFDMFSKVAVTGADQTLLYQRLTSAPVNPSESGPVKWNFEKFLIGRDGKILDRFRSNVEPQSPKLIQAIETAMAAG